MEEKSSFGRILEAANESASGRLPKPSEDKPKFQNLRSLVGLRVVVQEKNGPIVTGLFSDFSAGEGYLRIADASVTGRSKKVSPPFVLVHFTAIAHIHPEVETEKV